jgi:hypothetical protein
LWEADAAVRQKVRRLDATDCAFHQVAEFLALLISDRGVQVLHFDQAFADEYDLGDFGNARHPRDQVENFVAHLAEWAEKDRNALHCQLNNYPSQQEGAA